MSHEMVVIDVDWFDSGFGIPDVYVEKHPDCLWFMTTSDKTITQIEPFDAKHERNNIRGAISFTPLPSGNNFLSEEFVSGIDEEVKFKGIDDTFGENGDVPKLAAYALKQHEEIIEARFHSQFISLYKVEIWKHHNEWEMEIDIYFELLGILDTNKLPLALNNEFVVQPIEVAPIAWPESPLRCHCEDFEEDPNDPFLCLHCGGGLF